MKHVLCFGDSNTWGYIPGTEGERFPFEERYPGILQGRLGAGIRVHEEGLNGRMTGWDDPHTPDRNALKQIAAILETHRPLDMIVVMLGTNDLKRFMDLEAVDCALALDVLIERIEAARCGASGGRPELLVVSPPHVVETPTPFGRKFDGAIPKSHAFAAAYAEIAAQRKCLFLDAGPVARTSARDGIHLDKKAHLQLAEAVATIVKRTLGAG
jgi:lysophospholipase L1-like esterase